MVGRIKQEKPTIQKGANYIPVSHLIWLILSYTSHIWWVINIHVLKKCAMVKPSANNSQVLVWRPKQGESVCVVPPKGNDLYIRSRHHLWVINYDSWNYESFSWPIQYETCSKSDLKKLSKNQIRFKYLKAAIQCIKKPIWLEK